MEYIKILLQPLRENSELAVTFNPPATIQELRSLKEALKQDIPKDIEDLYSYCNGFETLDYLFRFLPITEVLQYKSELNVSSFDFAEYMIYSDVWTLNVINSEEYTITNENHKTEEIVTLSNSIFEFLSRYAHGGVFGTNGLYEWSEQIRLERSRGSA